MRIPGINYSDSAALMIWPPKILKGKQNEHYCLKFQLVIIPPRFPGKPLALLKGKPIINRFMNACKIPVCFPTVCVATDHLSI